MERTRLCHVVLYPATEHYGFDALPALLAIKPATAAGSSFEEKGSTHALEGVAHRGHSECRSTACSVYPSPARCAHRARDYQHRRGNRGLNASHTASTSK
jgi:hypothetical protein